VPRRMASVRDHQLQRAVSHAESFREQELLYALRKKHATHHKPHEEGSACGAL